MVVRTSSIRFGTQKSSGRHTEIITTNRACHHYESRASLLRIVCIIGMMSFPDYRLLRYSIKLASLSNWIFFLNR